MCVCMGAKINRSCAEKGILSTEDDDFGLIIQDEALSEIRYYLVVIPFTKMMIKVSCSFRGTINLLAFKIKKGKIEKKNVVRTERRDHH